MAIIGKKLRSMEGGKVAFMCPGCGELHALTVDPPAGHRGPRWAYNGNPDAPTFTPSIKVTGKQCEIVDGEWTGNWVLDENGNAKDMCCHSFVTDGRIRFLGDCTHELADQTVELPDIEEWT